jgi:hypothetical protein
VAFAPPPSPRPATAAMRTLIVSMPAAERILMAFRAAEEAEE